jgi:hypothetical protein
MNSWIIRYSAESTGLKLQEIKLHNNHPKVEEITISTDDSCKLIIAEITLKDICNEEEAIEIGDKLINVLLDQIAIEYDISTGNAERYSCNKKVQQEGNHLDLCMLPFSFSSCGTSNTPLENQLNTLKDRLKKVPIEININLQKYRSCLSNKDTIAKFMLLYNLLLVIAGETQAKAEELIVEYEPEAENTKMLNEFTKKLETVYTRLRNEIAHSKKGCSAEKTRSEIDFCINKFQEIVRKAVLEEI